MKTRHDGSRAAALTLALLMAVPSGAGARAGVAPASDRVVVVDVESSIDRGEQLARAVQDEAESAIRAHDVATEIDPANPRKLTIAVGGEKFAYRVRIVVERDGVAGEPQEIACECTQDELLAKVRESVEARADDLDTSPGEEPAATTGPADPDGGATDPPIEQGPAPLGGMGKGGIAALVIGVAALGTGIGLAVVGKRSREAEGFEGDARETDFRPPGYALIAIGGAAVVTGIALIAVDRVRARRRTTAWVPQLGPGFAGLMFQKRF